MDCLCRAHWTGLLCSLLSLLPWLASCRSPVPPGDLELYRGPATARDDTRDALWLPEGVFHRLEGSRRIAVAAGGACAVTLEVGGQRTTVAAADGWVPITVPAGQVDVRASSACGAGAALDLPASRADRGERSSRPPLVLISIDTLRPDFLGAYGDPGGLSPNLDTFAKQATRYSRARAHAPWTGPSVAALMTGRQSAGLDRMAELAPTLPTLAESLTAAGYRTVAAINNPRLAPETGMNRGFRRYRTFSDDETLVASIPELLEAPGPVFLWAHLLGPHLPLDPAPEDLAAAGWAPALGDAFYEEDDSVAPDSPFTEAQQRRIRALYRADLHHADRNLGALLKVIEAHLPGAVVVFTSDHGEELWEHGQHGHGHAFWREVLAVPLLIRGPGFAAGGLEPGLVRLCDVAPTLLRAAGAAVPTTMVGRPLQEQAGDRWAEAGNPLHGARMVTVEGPRWKLIQAETGGPAGLYDVAGDPAEAVDMLRVHPEVGEAMAQVAKAFVDTAPPPPGPSRVALTISSRRAVPARVTLTSPRPLRALPGQPPGRWGRVEVRDDGRTWRVTVAKRTPNGEGVLVDLVLEARGAVTAEVEVDGKPVPDGQWRLAGGPAAPGVRTIQPDQEGWRSDDAATDVSRVDLWMQPRGEPPLAVTFPPALRERLRALGYVQ